MHLVEIFKMKPNFSPMNAIRGYMGNYYTIIHLSTSAGNNPFTPAIAAVL